MTFKYDLLHICFLLPFQSVIRDSNVVKKYSQPCHNVCVTIFRNADLNYNQQTVFLSLIWKNERFYVKIAFTQMQSIARIREWNKKFPIDFEMKREKEEEEEENQGIFEKQFFSAHIYFDGKLERKTNSPINWSRVINFYFISQHRQLLIASSVVQPQWLLVVASRFLLFIFFSFPFWLNEL